MDDRSSERGRRRIDATAADRALSALMWREHGLRRGAAARAVAPPLPANVNHPPPRAPVNPVLVRLGLIDPPPGG